MNYIVLSEEENKQLMELKTEFADMLKQYNSDIIPVKIKSGEYILSISCLKDPAFDAIKSQIGVKRIEASIREVLDDEFINID